MFELRLAKASKSLHAGIVRLALTLNSLKQGKVYTNFDRKANSVQNMILAADTLKSKAAKVEDEAHVEFTNALAKLTTINEQIRSL